MTDEGLKSPKEIAAKTACNMQRLCKVYATPRSRFVPPFIIITGVVVAVAAATVSCNPFQR